MLRVFSSHQVETAPANALSSSEKMLNELEMQKPEGALAVSRSSRSWQDIGCNDPSMLVLVVARIRVEGLCSLSPLPVAQRPCRSPCRAGLTCFHSHHPLFQMAELPVWFHAALAAFSHVPYANPLFLLKRSSLFRAASGLCWPRSPENIVPGVTKALLFLSVPEGIKSCSGRERSS